MIMGFSKTRNRTLRHIVKLKKKKKKKKKKNGIDLLYRG
jgi:hypothetical protein